MNSAPREYNITLRSSTTAQVTPLNSIDYDFDWSVLPDVPYKVSFTFVSASFPTTLLLSKAVITTDLFLPNNYKALTDLQVASSSNILGNVYMSIVLSSTNFLQCSEGDNPITILSGRPRQNVFNISVRQIDATTLEPTFDIYGYTLTLHLQEVV